LFKEPKTGYRDYRIRNSLPKTRAPAREARSGPVVRSDSVRHPSSRNPRPHARAIAERVSTSEHPKILSAASASAFVNCAYSLICVPPLSPEPTRARMHERRSSLIRKILLCRPPCRSSCLSATAAPELSAPLAASILPPHNASFKTMNLSFTFKKKH